MKLGLFGGSFDPIHRGHVEPVRRARQSLGLDRVLYLPTANPPHKPGRVVAPAFARFAMVELALLREDGLFASPHELVLDRPSYTAETLEHFRRAQPEAQLHLLLGADSFVDLHHWVRWRDIVSLARIVVLARPGFDLAHAALPRELRELAEHGGIDVIADAAVDVSSTEVRAALMRGEAAPDEALDPLVVEYLCKYSLYR